AGFEGHRPADHARDGATARRPHRFSCSIRDLAGVGRFHGFSGGHRRIWLVTPPLEAGGSGALAERAARARSELGFERRSDLCGSFWPPQISGALRPGFAYDVYAGSRWFDLIFCALLYLEFHSPSLAHIPAF